MSGNEFIAPGTFIQAYRSDIFQFKSYSNITFFYKNEIHRRKRNRIVSKNKRMMFASQFYQLIDSLLIVVKDEIIKQIL